MAERPSSPGPRKAQSKRGQHSPHSQVSSGRGRGQHGTPFKPNTTGPNQNNDQNRRGGHGKTSRGVNMRGQGRGRATTGSTSTKRVQFTSTRPSSLTQPALKSKPSADEIRHADLGRENLSARRDKVHSRYVEFRKNAIENRLMDDPNRRKTLQDSIRKIGTCQQMCDEKERVDRMFENLVDLAETEPHPESHKPVPIEGKMVKRFRRAAAGDPDQQLEELRTPSTLRKTMDYLIQDVISSDSRLPQVHKFVWDRTRAIRNDFTIQNFYNPEDVRHEVHCYEQIARFHIVSMHQMVNPEYIRPDEHYDGQQDLEQLNKTILTLLMKYDDFRHVLEFPNEAEFRAYFILIEMRNSASDLEDRVQRWPRHILSDGRVKTALKLYTAACSTDQRYGTLGTPIPVAMAQANSGRFWTLLDSLQVSYLMACTVEMSFFNIRFTALNSLWIATKNASKSNQSSLRFWTKAALEHYLGFDDEEQAADFCSDFGLSFATKADPNTGGEEQYLDFTSNDTPSLDKNLLSMSQVFSEQIVEKKRHYRTLFAVINGMSVAEAKCAGQVDISPIDIEERAGAKQHSMFVDEDEEEPSVNADRDEISSRSILSPEATVFLPQSQPADSSQLSVQTEQPRWMTHFGQKRSPDSASPGGLSKAIFAHVKDSKSKSSTSSPFTTVESTSPFQNRDNSSLNSTLFQPSVIPVTDVQQSYFTEVPLVVNGASFNFNEGSASRSICDTISNPLIQTTLNSEVEKQVDLNRANPFVTFDTSASIHAQNGQQNEPSEVTSSKPFTGGFQVTSSLSDTIRPSPNSNSTISQPLTSFKFNTFSNSNNPDSRTNSTVIGQQFSFDTNSQSVLSAGALTHSTSPDPQHSTVTGAAPVHSRPLPAKRPSFESIHVPSVTRQRVDPERQKQTALSTVSSADSPRQASVSPSSRPKSHSRLHSPSVEPISLLSPQPQDHKEKEIDQDQLLHDLVRLGLVQTNGIVDMFVSRKLCNIVRDVFDGFQQRRFENKITAIRHRILKRKFFLLWKEAAESRRLHKQAEKRRSRLAASMRADAEKERRRELELEQIVEADRISRQIQKEQRRMRQKVEEQNRKEEKPQGIAGSTIATIGKKPDMPVTPIGGRKRKSHANGVLNGTLNDTANGRAHKRSRTLGSLSDTSSSRTQPAISHLPDFDLSSNLRRSISQKSLRQSVGVGDGSVDKTRTDYFRLIAYGLDPTTPLIPLTQAQVEEQKRRKAEKDAATIAKYTRRRGRSVKKADEEPANMDATLPSPSLETAHAEQTQAGTLDRKSAYNPDDDPILKQLRETRQTLAEDTKWFKEQTAVLAKEIEQHEEFRRSLSQSQSSNSSFGVSVNGFARSLNGYEYVPPDLKPGQTLSRTEERIRQTGAHGLATAPIGGSSRSTYTPVAMSKKSALRYSQGISEDSSRPQKRSIDQVYGSNGVNSHSRTAHPTKVITPLDHQQLAKKPRTNKLPTTTSFGYIISTDDTKGQERGEELEDHEERDLDEQLEPHNGSPYDNDLYVGEDEEYIEDGRHHGDDEAEEDENEEEGNENQHRGGRGVYNPMFFSDDDDDDTDELQEDEQEEQNEHDEQNEQDESAGDEDSTYMASYGYGLQAPVPFSRHGSQALSGVATPDTGAGASADDAIELSD